METKICASCGRELPIENFAKHGKARDGYKHSCRECLNTAKNNAKKQATDELMTCALSRFTPRDLMEDLARRGYKGKLYTEANKEKEITVDGMTGIFVYKEKVEIDITNF